MLTFNIHGTKLEIAEIVIVIYAAFPTGSVFHERELTPPEY